MNETASAASALAISPKSRTAESCVNIDDGLEAIQGLIARAKTYYTAIKELLAGGKEGQREMQASLLRVESEEQDTVPKLKSKMELALLAGQFILLLVELWGKLSGIMPSIGVKDGLKLINSVNQLTEPLKLLGMTKLIPDFSQLKPALN